MLRLSVIIADVAVFGLASDCNLARIQSFPAGVSCGMEMKCSERHVCALLGATHCNYACLDRCTCDGHVTPPTMTLGGASCICPTNETMDSGAGGGELDCRTARSKLFPLATKCANEMKCGESQTCASLTSDGCEHSCVDECPCRQIKELSVCACDSEPFAYDCKVEDSALSFNVVVPKITRFNHSYDDRSISLIPNHLGQKVPFGVFQKSQCRGDVRGDLVHFEKMKNESGCDFGYPEKGYIDGYLHDIWQFAVGFDDLVDVDPLGNHVVKRYGRHWNLQCAVKIEETRKVMPLVDGQRTKGTFHTRTKVPFELELYTDSSFTTKLAREIDIGVLSDQSQRVFVQAKVNMEGKLLHIDHCYVTLYDKGAQGKTSNKMQFNFITDGCATDDEFVRRNCEMQARRVHFANASEPTTNVDQFAVDLWDVSISPQTRSRTYHFECKLIACDALNGPEQYCHAGATCSNRYDNLQQPIRRRRSESEHQSALLSQELVILSHSQTSSSAALDHIPFLMLLLPIFIL